MYARFTDRARKVMQLANQVAQSFNQDHTDAKHILLALLREGEGVAARALRNVGLDKKAVRRAIEQSDPSGPEMVTLGKLPLTHAAKKVVERAVQYGSNRHDAQVGTAHILLGLISEPDPNLSAVLAHLRISEDHIHREVLSLLEGGARDEPGSGNSRREAAPAARPFEPAEESSHKKSRREIEDIFEESSDFERFTDVARRAMWVAGRKASGCNHDYIGTEHILLGLIDEAPNVATEVLASLGANLRRLRLRTTSLISYGPEPKPKGTLPLTPRSKRVLELATEESRAMGHDYIGTEHLLLGLIGESEGVAGQALFHVGVHLQAARQATEELLRTSAAPPLTSPSPAPQEPAVPARQNVLRIIDASGNRASEGLRVVEDYVRFVLEDATLTEEVKQIRHDLIATLTTIGRGELLAARDILGDVGTDIKTAAEHARDGLEDVLAANLGRAMQALRSLGEYGKIVSADAAAVFERLRYQVYQLESRLASRGEQREKLLAARLYVLIDGRASSEEFLVLVDNLLAAGVCAIQLRDKRLADRELLERGRVLRRRIDHFEARTLFIMNDRPDLAVLAGADGVHVGQDELTVADARKIVGGKRIVGVSTHSIEQARDAQRAGADYIGVGPTFPSQTKEFVDFPGLALAEFAALEIAIPAFAIGGITLDNVSRILATGLGRVAVSAAIAGAGDPASEVRKWRNVLEASR